MIIIAAMTGDRVIGKRGRLPWNIPEEYAHFLSLIRGATVIMGRRSYEAFGSDCTCKHMIVVSRSSPAIEGVTVCGSVEDAIVLAAGLGQKVFIAGGSTVYEQTIHRATEMDLSFIRKPYDGDSYFPEFDLHEWDVLRREPYEEFEFVVYARRRDTVSGNTKPEGGYDGIPAD
jgi:dihydrofolate reductase